jgi:predicted nucleic acid-binding protein
LLRVFFDTSVLVAASERSHPHFSPARSALVNVIHQQDEGFVSAHSIAEMFAALTRLPIHPRINPVEAERIVTENVIRHFTVIPLALEDYMQSINGMASLGLLGAKVYDLLLLSCAARSNVDRIYTFNLADIKQLAPPELHGKICSP